MHKSNISMGSKRKCDDIDNLTVDSKKRLHDKKWVKQERGRYEVEKHEEITVCFDMGWQQRGSQNQLKK